MSAVADKLRKARALVERGWARHHYAIGKSGKPADICGPKAVCFCAAGAIGRANHSYPNSSLAGMREMSIAVGGDGSEADILIWNDEPVRTKADVLAAFDAAITVAESQQ